MSTEEHDEQVKVIRHADELGNIDDRWNSLHAIPNGGSRGDSAKVRAIRGKALRAEGVRSGVPDLFLPEPVGEFHGLFIEMKKRHDGVVSADQKKWIARLKRRAYCVQVCEGADKAIEFITNYLAGKIRTKRTPDATN
jgi:hypothetical protein